MGIMNSILALGLTLVLMKLAPTSFDGVNGLWTFLFVNIMFEIQDIRREL